MVYGDIFLGGLTMKIIFLGTVHFTQKLYNDLYIEKISKHYKTEMWSILKINKMIREESKSSKFHDQIDDVDYIETFDEFERKLQQIGHRPIIITSFFDPKSLKEIYDVIHKYDGVIIDLYKDAFTTYIRKRANIFNKNSPLFKRLKDLLVMSSFIRTAYWRLINRSYLIDYCLAPPKLTYLPAKNYVPIHHVKYDNYLDVLNEKPIVDNRYAVFLDSNLPYLNDIIILLGEESVNPEKYYRLLNEFFDYIEKRFNLEVIIAPHPQANYSNDLFNRRKIIKYKTSNLIHNSEFVITHDTTSNMNAILSNKPMIFVYYNEMLNKGTNQWALATMEYSKILNAPLIDLENDLNFKPTVDNKAYKRFKDKYIVNNRKKDKSNEEIIIEFLESLFNK